MPAGNYYIGDLCYVMGPQWDEVCNIAFDPESDNGEFQLKNGIRFALYSTKYGDGTYQDQVGNKFPVDAGLIGCILIDDIDDPKAIVTKAFKFTSEFETSEEKGIITFGHVEINTGDEDSEEDTYDPDDDEEYQ